MARRILRVMGSVHDILEAKGRQAALQLDFDRQVVEAAASYMADEDGGIGFLYSGWCQGALPHRRLPRCWNCCCSASITASAGTASSCGVRGSVIGSVLLCRRGRNLIANYIRCDIDPEL